MGLWLDGQDRLAVETRWAHPQFVFFHLSPSVVGDCRGSHDTDGDGFLDIYEFDSLLHVLRLQHAKHAMNLTRFGGMFGSTVSPPDDGGNMGGNGARGDSRRDVEQWVKDLFRQYDYDQTGSIDRDGAQAPR